MYSLKIVTVNYILCLPDSATRDCNDSTMEC